jgi:hypothetical protein
MELPHARDAAPADLGGEDRPEPVPPEAHALVADLDAALVQHVLDVPQGKRSYSRAQMPSARDSRTPALMRTSDSGVSGPNRTASLTSLKRPSRPQNRQATWTTT